MTGEKARTNEYACSNDRREIVDETNDNIERVIWNLETRNRRARAESLVEIQFHERFQREEGTRAASFTQRSIHNRKFSRRVGFSPPSVPLITRGSTI